jgi:hypothetical protein
MKDKFTINFSTIQGMSARRSVTLKYSSLEQAVEAAKYLSKSNADCYTFSIYNHKTKSTNHFSRSGMNLD